MQRKMRATLPCGRGFSLRQVDSRDEKSASTAVSTRYCGTWSSGKPVTRAVPSKAGDATFARCLFIILSVLTWKRINILAEAAQQPVKRPQERPQSSRAFSLALDAQARQTQFRFSPYADHSGSSMKFSTAALRKFAQQAFPRPEDNLKKRKFMEVASQIDLSGQVLDLSPVNRRVQLRAMMEGATNRLGFKAGKLRNPLGYFDAVRAAFHSFVNKQEVKAMATLHRKNPPLAKQLEKVNITSELRHLLASSLPAIRPSNASTEDSAALNKVASFYADLSATRNSVLQKALKKVDLTTPLDLSQVLDKESATKSSAAQLQSLAELTQKEAAERVAAASKTMSSSEKLDFAAAGLTYAELKDIAFQTLLEKVKADTSQDKNIVAVASNLIEETSDRRPTKGRRQLATKVGIILLLTAASVAVYGVTTKYLSVGPKRKRTTKQSAVEEDPADLDLDELAKMPLSALRRKARMRRRSQSRRIAMSKTGKIRIQPASDSASDTMADNVEATTEQALVRTKRSYSLPS